MRCAGDNHTSLETSAAFCSFFTHLCTNYSKRSRQRAFTGPCVRVRELGDVMTVQRCQWRRVARWRCLRSVSWRPRSRVVRRRSRTARPVHSWNPSLRARGPVWRQHSRSWGAFFHLSGLMRNARNWVASTQRTMQKAGKKRQQISISTRKENKVFVSHNLIEERPIVPPGLCL